MSEYNYDQPHEHVHASAWVAGKGYPQTAETRRQPVTAFLCVYEVDLRYGGPQEGGWYQDVHRFTGAAFPFQAEQDFEARELNREEWDRAEHGDSAVQHWYDDEADKHMGWVPVGLPHVTDEPTRVRLQSARQHLVTVYGEPGTCFRSSVRPKGTDYVFVYELTPSAFGNRPLIRYA
jgi:hypothetical protein